MCMEILCGLHVMGDRTTMLILSWLYVFFLSGPLSLPISLQAQSCLGVNCKSLCFANIRGFLKKDVPHGGKGEGFFLIFKKGLKNIFAKNILLVALGHLNRSRFITGKGKGGRDPKPGYILRIDKATREQYREGQKGSGTRSIFLFSTVPVEPTLRWPWRSLLLRTRTVVLSR